MNYKILFLQSAEQDLIELKDYITKNFSRLVWGETYNKIKKSIRHLKLHPLAGSIPEEIKKLGLTQYRQIISGKNRIIYEVRQQVIYIYIIADTRKDMNSLLLQKLLKTN